MSLRGEKMFYLLDDVDFLNSEKIYPLKQREINEIVKKCGKFPINKLIVFGSSVTTSANPWSDIDIYIETQEEDRKHFSELQKNIKSPLDLWLSSEVDENLRTEILKKGVVVYECRQKK